MKSNRNRGYWLAIPALLLMGFQANAASQAQVCPKKSAFTADAAQTLFKNRKNPEYRLTDPDCNHRATYSVTDGEGTGYIEHAFFVGANPGDKVWKYAAYEEDKPVSPRPAGVSLAGLDELFRLADSLTLPMSSSYSKSDVEPSLTTVVAEYSEESIASVNVLKAYFAKASATKEDFAKAQESMNVLLALSGVSITCSTLSNRLKYKSPACDGTTGAFDVIGCQFNYDATQATRKRGTTRGVFYTLGHRGEHAHALESRTYLCSDNADRAELQSWFSTASFRQICRREDYDIPYQTQAGSCN